MIEKSNDLGPQYLRVLAFNEKGREYLSSVKKMVSIPIITTASLWRKVVDQALKRKMEIDVKLLEEQLERDFKASDFYSSLYRSPEWRSRGSEMLSKVIYEKGHF